MEYDEEKTVGRKNYSLKYSTLQTLIVNILMFKNFSYCALEGGILVETCRAWREVYQITFDFTQGSLQLSRCSFLFLHLLLQRVLGYVLHLLHFRFDFCLGNQSGYGVEKVTKSHGNQ
uniref:Uncharacterized protein n=1 Tax=Physcomitrium patens TaxID=3218 RepID=A0A2K1JD74_PHYPA|nr:hypothetical protein PHYPA_019751 [Physcomitrium patens]